MAGLPGSGQGTPFDHLFGTFPGADGIPPSVPCETGLGSGCYEPFFDHNLRNFGGPDDNAAQLSDIDGGKMDGFLSTCVAAAGRSQRAQQNCLHVLGYRMKRQIPAYWSYAQHYVLFDHFYESVLSAELAAHLALFSGWPAVCTQTQPPNVNSCSSTFFGKVWSQTDPAPYLWTDITYLLWQNGISWAVYNDGGLDPVTQPFGHNGVQLIDNVAPGFETVNDDGQEQNTVFTLTDFYGAASSGALPAVSWVLPNYADSEHGGTALRPGQKWANSVISAIAAGPDWNSSAIVLLWIDTGGYFDQMLPPPAIDALGPGLRVPAILISPYAKAGYIDHQTFTSDSLLTLIEDVFLNGERMSQSGRPDPRPDYRDESGALGDLLNAFNFAQTPRRATLYRGSIPDGDD